MTMAPTAEYDAMVLETFLPIGYQLLFIDPASVQDSDNDEGAEAIFFGCRASIVA